MQLNFSSNQASNHQRTLRQFATLCVAVLVVNVLGQTERISQREASDADLVEAATRTTTDRHTLITKTEGPLVEPIDSGQQSGGVSTYGYFLRTLDSDTAQIYVAVRITRAFNLDSAYSLGKQYRLTRINVEERFLGVTEHVGIWVSRDELRGLVERRASFEVSLSGRGNVLVKFHRNYLRGFLRAWERASGN